MSTQGVWREPDEETNEYPGLWVHDGRHSGSITVGRTRLPVNAFLPDALAGNWPELADEWNIPAEFTEQELRKRPVVAQLRRCLAVLEDGAA